MGLPQDVALPGHCVWGSRYINGRIFDEKAPPAPLQRKRALKGAKDEQHLRILRESNPLSQADRACSQ